jgi:hypothetical protein
LQWRASILSRSVRKPSPTVGARFGCGGQINRSRQQKSCAPQAKKLGTEVGASIAGCAVVRLDLPSPSRLSLTGAELFTQAIEGSAENRFHAQRWANFVAAPSAQATLTRGAALAHSAGEDRRQQ